MPLTKAEIDIFRKNFTDLVIKSNKILITSHINPDDDSIASVLVLRRELLAEFPGKNIDIYYESKVSERFSFLDDYRFAKTTNDLFEVSKSYDLLVYVDANEVYRATKHYEDLNQTEITKVRIDHHKTETNDFDLELVDPSISSTAEILYHLYFEAKPKIDKTDAELLFLGINGDTGSFNYVTAKNCQVFSVADRLIKEGEINVEYFKSQYSKISQEVFELLQKLFMNAKVLKMGDNPPFTYSYLEKEEKYSFSQIKQATNFYIDFYSKLIEGVNWSAMIYPRQGSVGLSMRSSVGGVNVRLLAEAIGRGGGHDLAAGVLFEDKTKNEVEKVLFDYLDKHKLSQIK
jgi:phosphoesterase RecJ-like protein